MADESGQSEKLPEQAEKKRQRIPLEIQERKLAPKPSMWPIILALTLVVIFIGVITHPIILAIGVALTIAAIIGWILEKH